MSELKNQFSTDINALNNELESAIKSTIEIAVKLGEKLIEVKKALPHGEFQSFIESNCTVKYRQAAKYMKLASNWEQLSKVHSDALLELSIEDNLRLIEMPKNIIEPTDDKATQKKRLIKLLAIEKRMELNYKKEWYENGLLFYEIKKTEMYKKYMIRNNGKRIHKYPTFESYVNDRFNMTLKEADVLIERAVKANLLETKQ